MRERIRQIQESAATALRVIIDVTDQALAEEKTSCYGLAEELVKKAKEAGKGGFLLFTFNEQDGHVSFILSSDIKYLKADKILTPEESEEKGICLVEWEGLDDYFEFRKAKLVAILEVKPDDGRSFAHYHAIAGISRKPVDEVRKELGLS